MPFFLPPVLELASEHLVQLRQFSQDELTGSWNWLSAIYLSLSLLKKRLEYSKNCLLIVDNITELLDNKFELLLSWLAEVVEDYLESEDLPLLVRCELANLRHQLLQHFECFEPHTFLLHILYDGFNYLMALSLCSDLINLEIGLQRDANLPLYFLFFKVLARAQPDLKLMDKCEFVVKEELCEHQLELPLELVDRHAVHVDRLYHVCYHVLTK